MRRIVVLVSVLGLLLLGLWLGTRGTDLSVPVSPAATSASGGRTRPPVAPRDPVQPVGTLTGTIFRAVDDAPIASAWVVLEPTDGEIREQARSARTDARGRYRFEAVAPGQVTVHASAPGLLGATAVVQVTPGVDVRDIDLVLASGGLHVRGRVGDVLGGPVESAFVRVTPVVGLARLDERKASIVTTDTEGVYDLVARPGRVRVEAWHPDYASKTTVLELNVDMSNVDFELVPMARIGGIVRRRSDGAPIPGARIVVERQTTLDALPGRNEMVEVMAGQTTTDADGRFVVRGLLPGDLRLRAYAERLASADAATVTVGIAEQRDGIELWLDGASVVAGRVVDATHADRAIAGARIEAGGDDGVLPAVFSDADGRFVFAGVPAGRMRLRAVHDAYLPSFPGLVVEVDGVGDRTEVALTLAAGLSVSGRVEPAIEAEVTLEPDLGGAGWGGGMGTFMAQAASTTTGAEGAFVLRPASSGDAFVVARASDGRRGRVRIKLETSDVEGVVVPLEDKSTLTGSVIDRAGAKVAGAQVRVQARQGGHSMEVSVNGRSVGANYSTSTQTGDYVVRGLDAGAYEVTVVDARGRPYAWAGQSGTLPAPQRVTLREGDTQRLDLRVEACSATIRGVVQDADGKPAPEVWVSVQEQPRAPAPVPAQAGERREARMVMFSSTGGDVGPLGGRDPVLADERGRFAVDGLCAGRYGVRAQSTHGGHASQDDVLAGSSIALELAPLATLVGVVREGVNPVQSYALRVSGPVQRTLQVRNAEGRYRAERLEAGSYRVRAATAIGEIERDVEVEAGATVDLDLELQRFAKVSATVVDEAGSPVSGARIEIGEGSGPQIRIEKDGDSEAVVTDAQGRFSTYAGAGPHILLVLDPRQPSPLAIVPFTVQSGETVDLGVVRPHRRDASGGRGPVLGRGDIPSEPGPVVQQH